MNVEVEVIAPIWHAGSQVAPDGDKFPVISLPQSDAVYLQGIGRVRIIEQEAKPEAKPAARKAKAK